MPFVVGREYFAWILLLDVPYLYPAQPKVAESCARGDSKHTGTVHADAPHASGLYRMAHNSLKCLDRAALFELFVFVSSCLRHPSLQRAPGLVTALTKSTIAVLTTLTRQVVPVTST